MRALLLLLPLACAVAHAQAPELIIQAGHTNSIKSVAFSPDGRLILSASSDHTLKLWEATTGHLIRNFERHTQDDVRALFSPDGKLIASVSTNDYIKLWDVGSGKLVREFDEAAKKSTASISGALSFSPDGRLLAAETDKFKVWDVASGAVVWTIDDYNGAAKFSPDGKVLAAATEDSLKLNLWDVASGRLLRTLEALPLRVPDSISFSPDGKLLAVLSPDTVDLWDVAGGYVVRSLRTAAGRAGGEVIAFSPDGKKLFVSKAGHRAITERTLELWDVASGKLSRSINGSGVFADSVSFSPDGKTFVTGGDEQIILWDAESGQTVRTFGPNRYSNEEKSARVSIIPERGGVAVVNGGRAKLWDANTGLVCTFAGRGERLELTPRSPDGKHIAVNHILWDARGCQQLGQIGEYYTFAFSPDGRAIAERDGRSIKLYDAALQLLRTLRGHTGSVRAAAFSPDSKLLASGSADQTIRLWDWDTGQPLRAFEGHTDYLTALAFSPNGQVLASGADDRTVRLWEVASGRLLNTLIGHTGRISALAFSPDGRLLASGARQDGALKLWDVQAGKLLRALDGHPFGVDSVAFSPDGATLVAQWNTERDTQNIVKLWRVASGQLVLDLQEPGLKTAAFSRDGHALLVASGEEYRDAQTRIYAAASGEVLADVIGFTDGRWIVLTPSGLFDGPPETWSQIAWRFAGNQVAPAELFFNEFYYPGLLVEILAGRTPPAIRRIAQLDRRQPSLRLVLPEGQVVDGEANARALKVKIEVSDAPAGAQDVRLFRNGSLVRAWRGDVLQGREKLTLEAVVPVVAGENRFTAYAFNRDQIKSADATLAVRGADSLRRAGVMYVLAVGVNRYANPQYDLKYAVADARAFAEEVRRQQERLGAYARVEVTPLYDAEATKANILGALKELASKVQPEDALVVYFAGHGTAHRNRFYLIPHDLGYAGPRDAIIQAGLDAVLAHSVSDRELEEAFEKVDAGQTLFVIDACNSGQALEAEEKRRGPMNSKGLAQLAYEKGMYILTAAQSLQAAQEASQLGHGLLTYALVEEGLKKAAADAEPKDGTVLIHEWLDYAEARVPDMQLDEMKRARARGIDLSFAEEERGLDMGRRSGQRPRVFYRRAPEPQPLVVAKTGN